MPCKWSGLQKNVGLIGSRVGAAAKLLWVEGSLKSLIVAAN